MGLQAANRFYYFKSLNLLNQTFFLTLYPLVTLLPILKKFEVFGKISNLGYATKLESEMVGKLYKDLQNKEYSESFQSNIKIQNVYDYVIIGSGPGATQAFDILKGEGSIAVIESGSISTTPTAYHHTFFHLANDFKNGGQEFILGKKVYPFSQAKVFGGGSEVNAGFYHKLPSHLLKDFCLAFSINRDLWKKNEDIIEAILDPKISILDPSLSPIARGAIKLGLNYINVPRWQTVSNNGIEHNGLRKNFWNKVKVPFDIFLNSTILDISDDLSFFNILVKNELGEKILIKCRKLIFSAGSINSPYLLSKFGFIKWGDIKFQWHPMYRVVAKTNQKDLGFNHIDSFQAWDQDYNYKLGAAVSTPGLLALSSGKRILKSNANTFRSYYVSITSQNLGRFLNKTQIPVYKLSGQEKFKLENGIQLLLELLEKGGAEVDERFKATKSNKELSSVHVFGSLPIGSKIFESHTTILKSNNRVQVVDGSIIPKPPFVNPQAVVMTACRIMAQVNEGKLDT